MLTDTVCKGVGRKIFRGGPIRMEPVLTTKNGRIFEIWELLERVCENPGGGHGPPCPPLPTPMTVCTTVYDIMKTFYFACFSTYSSLRTLG